MYSNAQRRMVEMDNAIALSLPLKESFKMPPHDTIRIGNAEISGKLFRPNYPVTNGNSSPARSSDTVMTIEDVHLPVHFSNGNRLTDPPVLPHTGFDLRNPCPVSRCSDSMSLIERSGWASAWRI